MDAKIVLLPGDGIGPEVVAEGQKALNAVARKFGHRFTFETCLIGGCAIDATGSALPDATAAACKSSQAVLLGAVGGPKWDDPREDSAGGGASEDTQGAATVRERPASEGVRRAGRCVAAEA